VIKRRQWTIIGAALSVIVLAVGVSYIAYAKAHSIQHIALRTASPNPSVFNGYGPNAYASGQSGYPYAYSAPSGNVYGSDSAGPNGYAYSPPPYGYSAGAPYGSVAQVGYGYGAPQGVSIGTLPQAEFGAYLQCEFDNADPQCNQQLANGTRCGYGYTDCVAVQLSCRLPVSAGQGGGFVQMPKGPYSPDPSSTAAVSGPWEGETYDWSHARWLPVPPQWVAPDFLHYAYVDSNRAIHAVDVASGSDQVATSSGQWQLLGYQTDGIYGTTGSGQVSGLWRIPPTGGAPTKINATAYIQYVAAGYAYGVALNYPAGSTVPVVRVDLKTGAATNWFSVPGSSAQVIGVDRDGHVLIDTVDSNGYGTTQTLWAVQSANAAVKLLQGNLRFSGPTMSDRYGLWLTAFSQPNQGTYLLTTVSDASGGVHPVFDRVSDISGLLAGACN
jgi:hypothetical protein